MQFFYASLCLHAYRHTRFVLVGKGPEHSHWDTKNSGVYKHLQKQIMKWIFLDFYLSLQLFFVQIILLVYLQLRIYFCIY